MRAGIGSRPWAGIDIGSYSVKLLATQGGPGSKYWIAESPLPPASNGDPTPEILAKAISDCLDTSGLSPGGFFGVSVGVSGVDVIVKQIALPMMDEDEVGSALRFEARKHLPFDPQGMVIDFQILGRYASEKRLDVLLAAASQERISRLLATFRLLGMDPDIIDAAPLALSNALLHGAEVDREAHVLLDLGHKTSYFTIYQRGEPYFSRRIEFGGYHLTEAIVKGARVPFEEAEEFKLAAGSERPGFRVDWNSPEMEAIHAVIRSRLAEEILRSMAFYRTLGRLPDSLNIWISGGSARLPGLATKLTELLGVSVLLFNPIDLLVGNPRSGQRMILAPQFAQAFGLALRSR